MLKAIKTNYLQAEDYNLLVIGVPNVGKSSLINLLRRKKLRKSGKATAVAPVAGVTRSVLEKIKVSHLPYLLLMLIVHSEHVKANAKMSFACYSLKSQKSEVSFY